MLLLPLQLAAVGAKGFRLRKFRVFTVLEMLEIPSCFCQAAAATAADILFEGAQRKRGNNNEKCKEPQQQTQQQ